MWQAACFIISTTHMRIVPTVSRRRTIPGHHCFISKQFLVSHATSTRCFCWCWMSFPFGGVWAPMLLTAKRRWWRWPVQNTKRLKEHLPDQRIFHPQITQDPCFEHCQTYPTLVATVTITSRDIKGLGETFVKMCRETLNTINIKTYKQFLLDKLVAWFALCALAKRAACLMLHQGQRGGGGGTG